MTSNCDQKGQRFTHHLVSYPTRYDKDNSDIVDVICVLGSDMLQVVIYHTGYQNWHIWDEWWLTWKGSDQHQRWWPQVKILLSLGCLLPPWTTWLLKGVWSGAPGPVLRSCRHGGGALLWCSAGVANQDPAAAVGRGAGTGLEEARSFGNSNHGWAMGFHPLPSDVKNAGGRRESSSSSGGLQIGPPAGRILAKTSLNANHNDELNSKLR